MTNSLNPIAPAARETLLSYQLLAQPHPLQVDGSAILTLVVSKSPDAPDGTINCSKIVVTLPVGKSADTLTPDASGIETQVPTDSNGNKMWSADNHAGVITLTPTGKDAGQFRAQGVSFVFAGFRVNQEKGTTTVSIDETALSNSNPAPRMRSADLLVLKFPTQFSLSDLSLISPDQPDIPYGGAAELMWTGVGDRASYSLEYQPADDGPPVTPSIGSAGPYTTTVPLTRSGDVTFTLTAKLPIPGQDHPLVVTRQLTVQIETPRLKASMQPLLVPPNGLARLEWDALNMASCRLDPGGLGPAGKVLEKSGVLLFLIPASPATRLFSITATPAEGLPIVQQFIITVDPAIVPNQPPIELTGQQGPTGQPGSDGSDSSDGSDGGPGGRGGPGLDATLTKTVPALDLTSNPARVIPITVTGGQGGTGGVGGWGQGDGGQGGPGGQGGNASCDLTIDPSLGPPAQYVINVVPGPGGDGGLGGESSDSWGPTGEQGPPGSTTPPLINEAQKQ